MVLYSWMRPFFFVKNKKVMNHFLKVKDRFFILHNVFPKKRNLQNQYRVFEKKMKKYPNYPKISKKAPKLEKSGSLQKESG